MGKYRVELHHWRNQQGYSCSEVLDNLDEKCTAEEYVKDYDGDLTPEDLEDAINVEIYDNDTDELMSEYWLQKKGI